MVAEFGIDSGWLDHPTVLDRLWHVAQARWKHREEEWDRALEAVKQNQYDRMHAKLAGR